MCSVFYVFHTPIKGSLVLYFFKKEILLATFKKLTTAFIWRQGQDKGDANEVNLTSAGPDPVFVSKADTVFIVSFWHLFCFLKYCL